jgi:hypothetical protein
MGEAEKPTLLPCAEIRQESIGSTSAGVTGARSFI